MRHTVAQVKSVWTALFLSLSIAFWGAAIVVGAAPATRPARPSLASANVDATIARIRDEGLNRSQVLQTLSFLTDVIGPRLTGSPNHKRANEWTRDKLSSWGLADAHLEGWQFGRGWSLKRFSAQIVEPQAIALTACPKAWSPGFEKAAYGRRGISRCEQRGRSAALSWKAQGGHCARCAAARSRRISSRLRRLADADLLALANADAGGRRRPTSRPFGAPTTRPRSIPSGRLLSFLIKEGAALVVEPSPQGDGGTIFVGAASIPEAQTPGRIGPRAWSTDAPATVPQIVLATEDYNRIVRMIQQGQKLKMAVDLQVEFQNSDGYNTIAEIPGADLKDQIVMLGGHIDSWHAGTGATDDAAGVAVCMEAVRIFQALNLKPRRTIRIGLWGGEEQGFMGSRDYVKRHFGSFPDDDAARPTTRHAARRRGHCGNWFAFRNMKSSRRISISIMAAAGFAASICRGTMRCGRSSTAGLPPSATLTPRRSASPAPAAPIICRSTPSACRDSNSFRTRSIT